MVAPTLDLVRQWYDLLAVALGAGRGHRRRRIRGAAPYRDHVRLRDDPHGASRCTVWLVVFDECHHLPSSGYALAARACLAPFRLGLTATPERADGRDAELADLIGPVVYRKDIVELSGDYLAEYDVERVAVELSPAERAEHDAQRLVYRDFVGSAVAFE